MPMMWRSVDLPAPDGPIIETNSPSAMSMPTRRSTQVLVGPWAYDFSRSRNEMSGPPGWGSRSAVCGWELREKRDMRDPVWRLYLLRHSPTSGRHWPKGARPRASTAVMSGQRRKARYVTNRKVADGDGSIRHDGRGSCCRPSLDGSDPAGCPGRGAGATAVGSVYS